MHEHVQALTGICAWRLYSNSHWLSAILSENAVRIPYSAKTENATTCTENGHFSFSVIIEFTVLHWFSLGGPSLPSAVLPDFGNAGPNFNQDFLNSKVAFLMEQGLKFPLSTCSTS